MRGKRSFLLWMICLALSTFSTPSCAQALPGPMKVVASFSILGDFLKNVGGERVDVTTLVGPDSDVHVYTPAPADARKIADAKLLVINGFGLEGWLPRLLQISSSNAPTVTATRGITPLKLGSDADPHAWQSVSNAKKYVANIRDALIAANPSDAEAFRSNAEAYLAKLDALDREVRAAVAQIPQNRRKVISTHDAFGYFALAYGIQFAGRCEDCRPDQRRKNPRRVSRENERPQADPPDSGRDRGQDRRDALFRQPDG
jgi:zinc/manganese transport system substrate-binding protein